jgi:hypothetical protein
MADSIFPRIAFGVPEISRVTGIPVRKLHYILPKNGVPGAAKLADRWALDTEVFFASFRNSQPVV